MDLLSFLPQHHHTSAKTRPNYESNEMASLSILLKYSMYVSILSILCMFYFIVIPVIRTKYICCEI